MKSIRKCNTGFLLGAFLINLCPVASLMAWQGTAIDSTPRSICMQGITEFIWDERFGYTGVSGEVYALLVSGNELYVGGRFSQAGNVNLDPPFLDTARYTSVQSKWPIVKFNINQ